MKEAAPNIFVFSFFLARACADDFTPKKKEEEKNAHTNFPLRLRENFFMKNFKFVSFMLVPRSGLNQAFSSLKRSKRWVLKKSERMNNIGGSRNEEEERKCMNNHFRVRLISFIHSSAQRVVPKRNFFLLEIYLLY